MECQTTIFKIKASNYLVPQPEFANPIMHLSASSKQSWANTLYLCSVVTLHTLVPRRDETCKLYEANIPAVMKRALTALSKTFLRVRNKLEPCHTASTMLHEKLLK